MLVLIKILKNQNRRKKTKKKCQDGEKMGEKQTEMGQENHRENKIGKGKHDKFRIIALF